MCHRNIGQTYHPNHDNIPKQLQCFAQAVHHFPDLWTDNEHLTSFLTVQGHKKTYVETIISYIHGLADIFYLTQIQLINPGLLVSTSFLTGQNTSLDPHQLTIVTHVKNAVFPRRHHYHIDDYFVDNDSEDSDCEDFSNDSHIEWQRPTLVTGKPGTGKFHAILACVSQLLEQDINIMVATPTGFLASGYRSQTPDEVTCDTVHSTIPVSPTESSKINWSLSRFDLIIIDELSMISETIFQHILFTLSMLLFPPVLLVSGDGAQQHPFTRDATWIIPLSNPLNNSCFVSSTYHFHLTEQHHVEDEAYLNFLNHIRHWVPTHSELDKIQAGRVICPDGTLNYNEIMQMFLAHPNITVLTFTNKAAQEINKLVSKFLYSCNIFSNSYI